MAFWQFANNVEESYRSIICEERTPIDLREFGMKGSSSFHVAVNISSPIATKFGGNIGTMNTYHFTLDLIGLGFPHIQKIFPVDTIGSRTFWRQKI